MGGFPVALDARRGHGHEFPGPHAHQRRRDLPGPGCDHGFRQEGDRQSHDDRSRPDARDRNPHADHCPRHLGAGRPGVLAGGLSQQIAARLRTRARDVRDDRWKVAHQEHQACAPEDRYRAQYARRVAPAAALGAQRNRGEGMATGAVLVTGTSSGIGYSIAAELPKHGYHAIAAMRSPAVKNAAAAAELRALAKSSAGRCDVVEIDVTSDASVAAGVASAIALAGRLDVLVNCAGIMWLGVTEAFSVAQLETVMQTNLYG